MMYATTLTGVVHRKSKEREISLKNEYQSHLQITGTHEVIWLSLPINITVIHQEWQRGLKQQ